MTATNVKRNERHKNKQSYNVPFMDNVKIKVKPNGIEMDGIINYGPREKEHFRGDMKTFEKRMREKGF
jgi:hypothetical protein